MSVNEEFRDQGISHSHYLERLKTGEVRKIISLVNAVDKELVAQIAARGAEDETFTKRRLEALLRDVRTINAEAVAELEIGLRGSVADLANYEADFQARRLGETIPVEWNITQPSPQQLLTAVLNRPFENALFEDHIRDIGAKRMRKIEGALRMGQVEGQTIPQIARRIRGTRAANYADGLLEGSRREIESLVRTSLNHASSVSRERTFAENSDLIKGVQWVSTLDNRTTLKCMDYDGKVFPIGEGPRPPAHWGACVQGTLIKTHRGNVPIEAVAVGDLVMTHMNRWRRVNEVMAKKYDGQVVTSVNNFGSSISLTHEHPILTLNKGWINAGQIEIGDVMFQYAKELERLDGIGIAALIPQTALNNAHNIETSLTKELVSYSFVSRTRGMTSAVNLKQSIPDFEVRDIVKDACLENISDSKRIKNRSHKQLMGRRILPKRTRLAVAHSFTKNRIMNWIMSFHSLGMHLGKSLRRRKVFSTPMIIAYWYVAIFLIIADRFDSWLNSYAVSFAGRVQGTRTDSMFSFNSTDAFTKRKMFGVNKFFDKAFIQHASPWVAAICSATNIHDYTGYVYNIGVEDDETYLANNIVVHNCRSSTIPVTRSWRELGIDLDEAPPGTRASMDGQVPDKQTYASWLKKQDAGRQREILGARRYEMYKDGTPIDRFVRDGRVLTIKELERRENTAV